MKRTILAALLLTALAATSLEAQRSGAGIGIILGEPTGVAGRLWLDERAALDGAAAWSLMRDGGAFSLHLDYVYHGFDVFDVPEGELPVYIGLGGRLTLAADPLLGLRFPLGLAYLFPELPIDLFAEIVPTLLLLPATGFDLSGGFGLRIYF